MLDKHQSIPVTVHFQQSDESINLPVSQLRVHVKRYYSLNYKTFSRNEAAVVAHAELTKPSNSTVTMKLDLPFGPELLPPTLDYSPHLKIEYKLVVTAKVRHGPIHLRKKLFDMPIIFGTLPAGTKAPRTLEAYSNIVENRSILQSKPTFLRPEPKTPHDEECLPAYDGTNVPPAYDIISDSNIIRIY
jgi:hypothetical protein